MKSNIPDDKASIPIRYVKSMLEVGTELRSLAT